MRRPIDRLPDSNLDRVAAITAGIAERIRDDDPRRLFSELSSLCELHPAKAAQILMVFGAWFDPYVTTKTLGDRAEAITETRLAVAV